MSTRAGATRHRRVVLVVVSGVLALTWLASTLGCSAIGSRLSGGQPLPAHGRLAIPTDAGLQVFSLDDRRLAPLIPTSAGEVVTSGAWSPDGTGVAYGLFHRRPGDPASVSEIYMAGVDGAQRRLLAERERPGDILDTPVWTADGREIIYSFFGQVAGKPVQRIDQISVDGGQRRTIVDNAYSPALSPDSRSLLFLRDERAGSGLWLLPLAGGEPAAVIAPGRYPVLAGARISPDGKRVVLAVVNIASAGAGASGWFAELLPPAAYAHGDPWDLWTFDLQGGDPRRITQINADEPTPAWSPDGRYVAFWSGGGLYLVGADGSDLRQVLDKGGYGAIDWTTKQ